MTLIWPLNKGHHSFWYQSISHTWLGCQLVNFCSRTHRLATIHSVLQTTDRRNPAAIVVKFKNIKIKFVKVHTGQSIQVFIGRRPVDVGIRYARSFQCCQRDLVTVNLNNVPDCSTRQFVAFLGVYELECAPISFTRPSWILNFMIFILSQLKFLKFKSKITFIKFDLHNYDCRIRATATVGLLSTVG